MTSQPSESESNNVPNSPRGDDAANSFAAKGRSPSSVPSRGSDALGSPSGNSHSVLREPRTRIELVRDIASILQAVATTIAILVAGIWFLFAGEAEPRLNIEHNLTHKMLNSDWTWLQATVSLHNVGNRVAEVSNTNVWVQQILPIESTIKTKLEQNEKLIAGKEVSWPTVGERYINHDETVSVEAGEKQIINYEFLIPAAVKSVKFYSFFYKTGQDGWTKSTIYDLSPPEVKVCQ